MSYRGYTTPSRVVAALGRDATAEELLRLPDLVEEAEAVIDGLTGASWLVAGPITELVRATDELVYLRHRPITAIVSVAAVHPAIGAVPATLAAGDGYAVVDGAQGLLRLSRAYVGHDLAVVYTAPAAVPAAVRRAATLLTAAYLGGGAGGGAAGVKSFSVGGEVRVTYADAAASGVPADVAALLAPWTRPVLA
jgi:hypothetical protein